MNTCSHLDQIKDVRPGTPDGCEECLKTGDQWVHLRLCMECGHVGCCDSSKNRHATKHFHKTKHPIIRSFEPDDPGADRVDIGGYALNGHSYLWQRSHDSEAARIGAGERAAGRSDAGA